MKRILLAAIAAAAISTPAFAQTTTINISGTAQPKCTVGATSIPLALVGDLSTSDGSLNTTVVNATLSGPITALCTGTANTISITANPITRTDGDGGAGAPFGSSIDYTATLSSADLVGSLSDTTAPGAFVQPNVPAFSVDDASIVLSNAALSGGATKILAGAYTGSIVVTLTPGGL